MRDNGRMQIRKLNNRGMMVAEFVLVIPWFCALLVAFMGFLIFYVHSQQAIYAGFMAGRVYEVWPEKVPGTNFGRDDVVNLQLKSVFPGVSADYKVDDEGLKVDFNDRWNLSFRRSLIVEPMSVCEEEDNKLPTAEAIKCM